MKTGISIFRKKNETTEKMERVRRKGKILSQLRTYQGDDDGTRHESRTIKPNKISKQGLLLSHLDLKVRAYCLLL